VYLAVRRPHLPSYLLESAEGKGQAARYSVIGMDPLLYMASRDHVLEVGGGSCVVELARSRAERARRTSDPLEVLREVMFFGDMQVPGALGPRFALGAVGYISYDFVRFLVDLDSLAVDDLRHPDLEFMLPGKVVIFDHWEGLIHYCSLMLLVEGSDVEEEYKRASKELEGLALTRPAAEAGRELRPTLRSNMKRAEFEDKVRAAKEYIRAGDAIQVVLSRRIELEPAPSLGRFYLDLRRINPSPYMFFLDFPKRSVVGSSPEILVKVDGREVVTRPIAGTRRRGRDEKEDQALERELLADEKERAEHLMLVDLARNDLGRVSEFDSVEVREFMKVEKYSHVQHLVSTVAGRLREDCDGFDALRATFPAGTVTGAPKVRAMEIIEELEPTRRGIYAGAVGSFSYTGQVDLAITIRTLIAERGRGYVQVGAGIVADSSPWKEYLETENKARALLSAAGV
ncbi:MAG: anthranilate synthase component I family protein, partial [Hadesarchaea archaeon]|nr:anthranilate synthase component I family protein [Hadesarchaea archaeon]